MPLPLASQQRVTLTEAVQRALTRSPQLAQQRQGVDNALLSRKTSWAAFLPTVSANTSGSLRSSRTFDEVTGSFEPGSSDSYSAGLSGSLTVFEGMRRFREYDAARADVRAAEARYADQRFQVTLQTKSVFFGALEQEELLEVARQRALQAEQNMQIVRNRTRLGEATISDSLRARLDVVNAEQAVLQAETALRAARFSLGRQIGVSEPVAPAAPGELEPGPLPLADAEIMQLAEEASPTVVAATESTNAAAASVSAARAAYFPSLRFSSGYSWANQDPSFAGGNTSWSMSLSMSYPIFNGFQRESSIDRAQFVQRVTRLQEDDARLAARERADAALQNLRTSERAIVIAEEATVVAAEDLRVVRARYEVGAATILDVLISQNALTQADTDLITTRYDYILARAELEAILGREL
ncbi:MAG: TolC family protein [Longimicrobiales bacterium]|nr:TolC family protein [Longimicrobiales bacterium]